MHHIQYPTSILMEREVLKFPEIATISTGDVVGIGLTKRIIHSVNWMRVVSVILLLLCGGTITDERVLSHKEIVSSEIVVDTSECARALI